VIQAFTLRLEWAVLPKKVYTGQMGFVAISEYFSGFEFILIPNGVHARPLDCNANR
jgi:hypothetical protein